MILQYFDYKKFWQDVYIHKQIMKLTIKDVCRESGIKQAAFYRLKNDQTVMCMGYFLRLCSVLYMRPENYFYATSHGVRINENEEIK